ncbi:MAG: hypothetical protein ABSF72_10955 [Candidatus Sulfotelmatobacter sp.]
MGQRDPSVRHDVDNCMGPFGFAQGRLFAWCFRRRCARGAQDDKAWGQAEPRASSVAGFGIDEAEKDDEFLTSVERSCYNPKWWWE